MHPIVVQHTQKLHQPYSSFGVKKRRPRKRPEPQAPQFNFKVPVRLAQYWADYGRTFRDRISVIGNKFPSIKQAILLVPTIPPNNMWKLVNNDNPELMQKNKIEFDEITARCIAQFSLPIMGFLEAFRANESCFTALPPKDSPSALNPKVPVFLFDNASGVENNASLTTIPFVTEQSASLPLTRFQITAPMRPQDEFLLNTLHGPYNVTSTEELPGMKCSENQSAKFMRIFPFRFADKK